MEDHKIKLKTRISRCELNVGLIARRMANYVAIGIFVNDKGAALAGNVWPDLNMFARRLVKPGFAPM